MAVPTKFLKAERQGVAATAALRGTDDRSTAQPVFSKAHQGGQMPWLILEQILDAVLALGEILSLGQ